MPVEARVFSKQQSAHEQWRNVLQGDEVGGRRRDIDGPLRAESAVGVENKVAAQSRDHRRHPAWRTEVYLLAHRESGRLCRTSAHTHFYRGRSKITAAAGRHSQA